jgi:hypothetical protein
MSSTSNLVNVPQVLKDLPNWVQWKLTPNESGELGKVPFVAGTNFAKHAASTRSATWSTFEEAIKNIELSSSQGVGFVIHGPAVEAGLVGFDLDGCRNPQTGDVTEWAQKLIDCLESYTEVTPSLTGVRIWVKGKVSGKECVFNLDTAAGYGDKVKIEVFSNARYFTVTGDCFDPFLSEIETRDMKEAYRLCREFKAKYPAKTKNQTEVTSQSSSNTSSVPAKGAQIQTDGSSTVITSKYEILMHGQIRFTKPFVIQDAHGNRLEYPSHSEADLALCTQSALLNGNDPQKIWNDYSQSSLARDKWLNREQSFRDHTISAAIKTSERIGAEKPAEAIVVSADPGRNGLETPVATPFVSVDGDAFMLEDIKPHRILLRTISNQEPIFREKTINQIFAWRGTGKTNLGLGITKALATAGSFLNWECPERSRVLYVEGEMPEKTLQERWKAIIGKTGGYSRLITIDKQPKNVMEKLSTQAGKDKVEATLKELESQGKRVDVLMLDSLSTLFNVGTNDEDNLLGIQDWLIGLRSRGYTIFWFTHTGKSGSNRGHSKMEDMLDVSIKLDVPDEQEPGIVHAIMYFDKARYGITEPKAEIKMRRAHSDKCPCKAATGQLIGCEGDSVKWEYRVLADANMMEAFQMFDDGDSLGEVARKFKITKSKAQRWNMKWDQQRAAQQDEEPDIPK